MGIARTHSKLVNLRLDCESVISVRIFVALHSLIRVILIEICPAGAKNFTNYVFVMYNSMVQAKVPKKNRFLLYKIDYFDDNRHRQTWSKWHNDFPYFG